MIKFAYLALGFSLTVASFAGSGGTYMSYMKCAGATSSYTIMYESSDVLKFIEATFGNKPYGVENGILVVHREDPFFEVLVPNLSIQFDGKLFSLAGAQIFIDETIQRSVQLDADLKGTMTRVRKVDGKRERVTEEIQCTM